MATQTRPPDQLVLVNDGSNDASGDIADEFAESRENVMVLHRPRREQTGDRLAQANELKAFQWAAERAVPEWDVIAKMDADLRLSPETLETIDRAFASNPSLGMAGVRLSEAGPNGTTVPLISRPEHVEGATKFYRRGCWDDIAPIPPILGWDTLDEFRARLRGWQTLSFSVPSGDPLHMRRMGGHGSILRSFRRWGVCSYGYGSHPLHVLLYSVRLATNRPPLVIGGLNYLAGWGMAYVRRAPRAEPELRAAVREEQLARIRVRIRRFRPRAIFRPDQP